MTAITDAAGAARRSRRLVGRSELFRIGAGILIVSAVLFGQSLYGALTQSDRLDPALRGATAPVDVVVVLDFTPERFHQEKLTEFGAFAGRDHAINRIRLRQVTPAHLAALARLPWVARIEAK